MTVGQLIETLFKFPQDSIVIMAKDPEGNGFSPLAEVTTSKYVAESTWSGELDEEDENAVDCVVLDPTN